MTRSWPTGPGTTRRSTGSRSCWPSSASGTTRPAKKTAGRSSPMTELAQIRGTLQQAEQECAKLHALAATAAAMIDEAYQAFGIEQPARHFAVLCDFDPPTLRCRSATDCRPGLRTCSRQCQLSVAKGVGRTADHRRHHVHLATDN